MRCAGSLLMMLLLSLSALSASTAEANMDGLSYNAISLTGRKWLRGRKAMAGPGHGGVEKKDRVGGRQGSKEHRCKHCPCPWRGGNRRGYGESAGRKSSGKRKFAGQVPLSSDYRIPRTHPPKNN